MLQNAGKISVSERVNGVPITSSAVVKFSLKAPASLKRWWRFLNVILSGTCYYAMASNKLSAVS